jgi:hypothetical protein
MTHNGHHCCERSQLRQQPLNARYSTRKMQN